MRICLCIILSDVYEVPKQDVNINHSIVVSQNPAPGTYGRMGRFGSTFAALSFRGVDPTLAEFDPHATSTEQFIELVDAIHTRNAKVTIDIAINHTGWAARLHQTHPEWLMRDPAGRKSKSRKSGGSPGRSDQARLFP